MHRILAFVLTASLLPALPLAAQKPQGAVIKVNNLRAASHNFPQVAMASSGDYVVVWQTGSDGSAELPRVWVRLFRADGAPRTKQFRVSPSRAGQTLPRLAVGADGSFVVVWQGGSSLGDTSVFGRRFDADGRARGGRFRLSSTGSGVQFEPAVAVAPDGTFVVAWTSIDYRGDSTDINARRFDAAGQPLGPEFRVNVATEDAQDYAQVAVNASGEFVIGWAGWAGEGSFDDVFVRRFAANGLPLSGEIQVEDQILSQYAFALGMAGNGAFVVLWSELDLVTDTFYNLFGQRFTANGEPAGRPFLVNVSPLGSQEQPAIAMAADGGFFAVWGGSGPEPNARFIVGRGFASDGTPLSSELRIDLPPAGDKGSPAVALDGDGRGLVVWRENASVIARRLAPP
ncbi:MAG TPA: hypothetical protein VGX68_22730 [Thermoanaerobaculia bacterium]|jgi:hypothetical protein|nr:hypothetical protein [Thermoanaerobaculia bacterium]